MSDSYKTELGKEKVYLKRGWGLNIVLCPKKKRNHNTFKKYVFLQNKYYGIILVFSEYMYREKVFCIEELIIKEFVC